MRRDSDCCLLACLALPRLALPCVALHHWALLIPKKKQANVEVDKVANLAALAGLHRLLFRSHSVSKMALQDATTMQCGGRV